jgi:hypothetical protein
MEKIIYGILLSSMGILYAQQIDAPMQELQETCLRCHQKEQIPDELMYRRYLMKFSTEGKMKEMMMKYLKNPKTEHSIMPSPFFLKFPMKVALPLEDEILEKNIDAFLEYYDVKKKLVLPQ